MTIISVFMLSGTEDYRSLPGPMARAVCPVSPGLDRSLVESLRSEPTVLTNSQPLLRPLTHHPLMGGVVLRWQRSVPWLPYRYRKLETV